MCVFLLSAETALFGLLITVLRICVTHSLCHALCPTRFFRDILQSLRCSEPLTKFYHFPENLEWKLYHFVLVPCGPFVTPAMRSPSIRGISNSEEAKQTTLSHRLLLALIISRSVFLSRTHCLGFALLSNTLSQHFVVSFNCPIVSYLFTSTNMSEFFYMNLKPSYRIEAMSIIIFKLKFLKASIAVL